MIHGLSGYFEDVNTYSLSAEMLMLKNRLQANFEFKTWKTNVTKVRLQTFIN